MSLIKHFLMTDVYFLADLKNTQFSHRSAISKNFILLNTLTVDGAQHFCNIGVAAAARAPARNRTHRAIRNGVSNTARDQGIKPEVRGPLGRRLARLAT